MTSLQPPLPKLSLDGQIDEARSAIDDYPRMLRTLHMRPAEIEFKTTRLRAVLQTLVWLQANEADIRAFIEAKKQAQGGAS